MIDEKDDDWPPRDPDFDYTDATRQWPSRPAGPDGPERQPAGRPA